MNPQLSIQKIIRNRPCFVLAKGASLLELKNNINMFNGLDVCWATLNDFHYIENTILSIIDKKFELVSDCATVLNVAHYEKTVRIPRFEEYLSRPVSNLLMLSELVVQECFRDMKRNDLLEQYQEKIITIDSLFSLPSCPSTVWIKPPNSITLLFAFLIAGGAKTIITFGLDGAQPNLNHILSYYMPEVVRQERLDAFGDYRDGSLKGDGGDFNNRWASILEIYKHSFNNWDVKLYNCSARSTIKAIPLVTYDEIRDLV